MKTTVNFQEKLNQILQKHVHANVSLAKELSEILNISMDSTYRRLRNETEYTVNEMAVISQHFNIPLEALNDELNSLVTFKVNVLNNDSDSYLLYLQRILVNIERLSHFDDVRIIIAAEDMPVFYHFIQPKLMNFKMIYWMKSIMNVTDFQHTPFEKIEIPEAIVHTAKEINRYYEKIESTEIWTNETILSTLKQIRFYWDAGFFSQAETAIEILEDLESILKSIQKNAETGYKFSKNGSMTKIKFHFYASDVMIGTNSIIAKTDSMMATYISYSTFNFMQTTNANFNAQNENWINNILSKSTLLSGVAEKQRNQFFKTITKQIEELRNYVNNT